ncbi:hypothetical protein APB85_07220 [Salegentibacter mishustinae]|nr:hypothetical protein APB85_07220 [Salegentibacter mishustinae]
MHYLYILYNKKLDRFYIGETAKWIVQLENFWSSLLRKVPKTKKPLSEYTEKSFSLVSQNLHNTRQ